MGKGPLGHVQSAFVRYRPVLMLCEISPLHPLTPGLVPSPAKLTDAAWRHVQISMVDGDMLDSLEEVARSVRRCKQPFGGLQLVLTGDFHQLPPVAKGRQAMAGAL